MMRLSVPEVLLYCTIPKPEEWFVVCYKYCIRMKKAKEYAVITFPRSVSSSVGDRSFLLHLPQTISKRRTPKLYISAFRVSWRLSAYSGAKYPLQ